MALVKVPARQFFTPQLLKETALLGVDLTLDDGTDYPDTIFTQSINAAIGLMERELGIVVDPFEVEGEQHDAIDQMRNTWWITNLLRRPVTKLNRFAVQFGNFNEVEVPTSWIKQLQIKYGTVNIMPSQEAITSIMFYNGTRLFPSDFGLSNDYMPGYFKFDYEAGFCFYKGTLEIPVGETEVEFTFDPKFLEPYEVQYSINADSGDPDGVGPVYLKRRGMSSFTLAVSTAPSTAPLVVDVAVNPMGAELTQAILLTAAMLPLDVAGDLIVGAGIASYSVSMDGISENVNTTSSATNSGYGARVLQFERELKNLMSALRSKYRPIRISAI